MLIRLVKISSNTKMSVLGQARVSGGKGPKGSLHRCGYILAPM